MGDICSANFREQAFPETKYDVRLRSFADSWDSNRKTGKKNYKLRFFILMIAPTDQISRVFQALLKLYF